MVGQVKGYKMKLTIISDKGSPMIIISRVRKKKDTIEITGSLMGAWPAKMYITPGEFGGFLRVALSPVVLMYLLMYPYYYIAEKFKKNKE